MKIADFFSDDEMTADEFIGAIASAWGRVIGVIGVASIQTSDELVRDALDGLRDEMLDVKPYFYSARVVMRRTDK